MALSFPWLIDIERDVRDKVDLPSTDPAQFSWLFPEEFTRACVQEQGYLWERISSLDKNWGVVVDTTLAVTSGVRTLTLPSTLRFIRKIVEVDSSGREVIGGDIDLTTWDALGNTEREAIFMPDQNQLYFMVAPTRSYSVKVIHGAYAIPVIHGVAGVSGATSLKLDGHESFESDLYNTLEVFVYGGTGAGQTRTISDYDGPTQTATVSLAWTTTPDATSTYTSRPSLPRDARDALVYGVTSRLLEKLQDERYTTYWQNREKHLEQFRGAVASLDRRGPLSIRDDYDPHGYIGWVV
jgi:hypothetical protein